MVDIKNTSGFNKAGKAPLVAIFTQHNMEGEKARRIDFQHQSIACSNDVGKTWTKYTANPVFTIRDNKFPGSYNYVVCSARKMDHDAGYQG